MELPNFFFQFQVTGISIQHNGLSSDWKCPKEMLPRPVVALSHVCVAQISCGHSHCCAVTDSGDVWAWGSSRPGVCGLGGS